MKKTLLTVTLAALAASTHASGAVVINEVYGGGGNASATYTNDFIELYNNGLAAVDLSLYSLYYAAAAGAFPTTGTTQITALTGTIAPGATFLVQEASSGAVGTALPTANQTGGINLSGTAGKVALALNGTVITAANTAGVQDFVGYGATANLFEGTAAAPAPSNTTSISRAALGLDTNQNSIDFTAGAGSPTAGVPEPATYAYVLGGVGALALGIRRRLI